MEGEVEALGCRCEFGLAQLWLITEKNERAAFRNFGQAMRVIESQVNLMVWKNLVIPQPNMNEPSRLWSLNRRTEAICGRLSQSIQKVQFYSVQRKVSLTLPPSVRDNRQVHGRRVRGEWQIMIEFVFGFLDCEPICGGLDLRSLRKQLEDILESPVVCWGTAGKKEDKVTLPFLCETGRACILKEAIPKTSCDMRCNPRGHSIQWGRSSLTFATRGGGTAGGVHLKLRRLKRKKEAPIMTQQDTGKFRTNTKDQYYTKASVAAKCVQAILQAVPGAVSEAQWIEPSAGGGVFLRALPAGTDSLGIDLDPRGPGILQGNFLDWTPTTQKPRIVFGNPPFGRQSSLAKSFIKHAATFASVIAFILPRSFVKPSMSSAFPRKFHCIYEVPLEKGAFEVNGTAYDVPCIFQIWQKKETDRPLQVKIVETGFSYVKHGEAFHIAFKRVGGLAGKCYPADPATSYNPNYHYFLRLDEAYVPFVKKILDRVNLHVFPTNTVGPRSLSKTEANEVLNSVLQELHGP